MEPKGTGNLWGQPFSREAATSGTKQLVCNNRANTVEPDEQRGTAGLLQGNNADV